MTIQDPQPWRSPVHTTNAEPDGYGWPSFADAALKAAYERGVAAGRKQAAADAGRLRLTLTEIAEYAGERAQIIGQQVTAAGAIDTAVDALAAIANTARRVARIPEEPNHAD